MTFPRALAWMRLFPNDVTYVCDEGPSWLREAVAAHNPRGARRVLVAWRRSGDELPALDAYAGVAVLNGHNLREEALRRAGFASIRRFAGVPHWNDVRWFVPLGRPAASASAFQLHTPVRRAARVKSWAARLAARTGQPFWYRDHLLIAQREASPLEQTLQEIFSGRAGQAFATHQEALLVNGEPRSSHSADFDSEVGGSRKLDPPCGPPDLELAFSTSNAQSERNRKLLLAVLDRRGRSLGFGKLSLSPASAPRVQQEARVLRALAERPHPIAAPQLLFDGCVDETHWTVVSPLAGRVPGPRLTAAHHRFLASLQSRTRLPVARMELFRSLRIRASTVAGADDFVQWLEQLRPTFETLILPGGAVHRDFAPWNLRRQRGAIAAFDWETAELQGPPLLDEFHHLLVTAYFLERTTPDRAAGRLLRLAAGRPQGLAAAQIMALQLLYLVDHLVGLLEDGYTVGYPKFMWWWAVFSKVAAPLKESLLALECAASSRRAASAASLGECAGDAAAELTEEAAP